MAEQKGMPVENLHRGNRNRRTKNRPVENESVKLAVFAAGIGLGRQVSEEGLVQFAPGKAAVENFAINTDRNGAEFIRVESANELACVAFPYGEKGGHAHTREVFFAIDAQVFEEYVAKGDLSDTLIIVHAQSLFHACLVDWIYALKRLCAC